MDIMGINQVSCAVYVYNDFLYEFVTYLNSAHDRFLLDVGHQLVHLPVVFSRAAAKCTRKSNSIQVTSYNRL